MSPDQLLVVASSPSMWMQTVDGNFWNLNLRDRKQFQIFWTPRTSLCCRSPNWDYHIQCQCLLNFFFFVFQSLSNSRNFHPFWNSVCTAWMEILVFSCNTMQISPCVSSWGCHPLLLEFQSNVCREMTFLQHAERWRCLKKGSHSTFFGWTTMSPARRLLLPFVLD